MKYIHHKYGKYVIEKQIQGKYHNYGAYPSLPIAQYMRDLLQKHEWSIPFTTTIFQIDNSFHVISNISNYDTKAQIKYLGNAKTRTDAEKLAENPLGETFLSKREKGYVINRKQETYGYFTDHQIAYDIREYIIQCEWRLPTHNKQYQIYINSTYYLLRVQNNNVKVIDHAENIEDIQKKDMSNIYRVDEGYAIHREINKKRESFRTYPTLKEAISMRDYLRQHNWNTRAFQKEYDKRYPQLPEYIYHENGKYVVRRHWKGLTKSYGKYNTLNEAESKVNYLKTHNWDSNNNLSIVNYDGIFRVYKNITTGYVTPFRAYYYESTSKEDAIEQLEQYKKEGFPKATLITNKYRYIHHNRSIYYIMSKKKKLCYTYSLHVALIARDVCEWLGMFPLQEGVYEYDGKEYVVYLNPYGTPIFQEK